MTWNYDVKTRYPRQDEEKRPGKIRRASHLAWQSGRAVHEVAHRPPGQSRPWLLLLLMVTIAGPGFLWPSVAWSGLALSGIWMFIRLLRRVHGWKDWGYTLACFGTAAGWLDWALAAHLAGITLPAGVVAWFVLAIPWWGRHQKHPEPPPQLEEIPTPTFDELIMYAYDETFTARRPSFTGTFLSDPVGFQGGTHYTINLIAGKHIPEDIVKETSYISSALAALGISRERVLVEAYPGPEPGEEGPDDKAWLTILNKVHIQKEIQWFQAPNLDFGRGLFADGPYPDGTLAWARLFKVDHEGRPHRTASGLYVGAQGSGKSRLVEHKVLEHMHSGISLVFFLDGQGGASAPDLMDHVDYPALTPEEWIKALSCAARLKIFRQRRQASRRLGAFYASAKTGEYFVQVVMDEAHRILAVPECARLVKMLLQEAEKSGIGCDIVTQVPLQDELGDQSGTGSGHVIRALSQNGNMGIFRTGDDWSGTVTIGKQTIDPRKLPARPGSHILAVDGAVVRQAPIRAIAVQHPDEWAAAAPRRTFQDVEIAAMDGGTGDYEHRWDRYHDYMNVGETAEGLDLGSINDQLNTYLGITKEGEVVTDLGGGKQNSIIAVGAIIKERGRIKRKGIMDALQAQGLTYSESAVDKALRLLAGTGQFTNQDGAFGEWTWLGADPTEKETS